VRDARETWRVERDIDYAVGAGRPIIVGPWMSEVGYEILYWIPFLRWLQRAYRLPRERVIAVSRGGVASWYSDLAERYVDVFTCVEPEAVARRMQRTDGSSKQLVVDAFESDVLRTVIEREGCTGASIVHPSLMYRLFRAYWSGRASTGFVERYTRFDRVAPPETPRPAGLPHEYVAAKFYAARSLPDRPDVRRALSACVAAIAERWPVVVLDTGLRLDDHTDLALDANPRVISLRDAMTAGDNLAIQTRVIAGARGFVGTCGSVAWLAPLVGIDTVPVFADSKLLHAHLQVAWRAYHRLPGAGAFSPCDVGGLTRLGMTLAADRSAHVASASTSWKCQTSVSR
jgi:hypothetical protein